MNITAPDGYSIQHAGPAGTSRSAIISDADGIEFGTVYLDVRENPRYTRHIVRPGSTSANVGPFFTVQQALDALIRGHQLDPCRCSNCQAARTNNRALPHRLNSGQPS